MNFYNVDSHIMATFRLIILKCKNQHTLSTLRFKILATGAYFQIVKEEYALNLALNKQKKYWFEGTLESIKLNQFTFLLL